MKNLLTILLCVFSSHSVAAGDVIISDNSFYITKDSIGSFTEFSIEFISDYENNLEGKYPNIDFASIKIDVNSNSKLDSGIDKSYGESEGNNLCTQLLLTSRSSMTCGSFSSGAKVFHYFLKTEINPMPHPVIKYLIPTVELPSTGGDIHIVFHLYSSGKGSTYYPNQSSVENLTKTYRVKL